MKEKLCRVSIEGFKSIKKCDIELGDINVLIGSNGAGKSNFISAFTFLHNYLKKELQLYSSQVGTNSLLYNGRKTTDTIGMAFSFSHSSFGFNLIPTENGRLIIKNEFYNYNGTTSSIKSSIGSAESHWDEGFDDDTNSHVKPSFSTDEWRTYHFHDTSTTSRMKQECNINNNTTLLSDAGNIAALLYRLKKEYPRTYYDILETIKLVAPYISDLVLEPFGSSQDLITLKWRQVGCDESFGPSQLSDGTIRFICLTTLLLQPTRLQPSTIIIDEPELGLHPYAIALLADMIKEASKKVQIIISTQSVELLDEFETDDVIVVETGSDGTIFKRLNNEDLSEWIENDYALGELWKKNIIGGRP